MSQAKVQQLYKLDRLLQEESGTLHSLQQDKVGISIIIVTHRRKLLSYSKNSEYISKSTIDITTD